MKTMIAKYPGTCVACSKPITRGQMIRFFGRGQAEHQYCFADARKARFKALWKQVADMPELERVQLSNKLGIVTCEGRELSMNNQCLLAIQCPNVSVVGGFRQWLAMGRVVRKGEHGHMLWVPTGCRKEGEPIESPSNGSPVPDNAGIETRFIIGTVFDVSQTEELPANANRVNALELEAA